MVTMANTEFQRENTTARKYHGTALLVNQQSSRRKKINT